MKTVKIKLTEEQCKENSIPVGTEVEIELKESFGDLSRETIHLKSKTIVNDVNYNKPRMIKDKYIHVGDASPEYPDDYYIVGDSTGDRFQVRKAELDSIISQGGGKILK